MKRHAWKYILGLPLFAACGGAANDDVAGDTAKSATESEPLIGGTSTSARPEIGYLDTRNNPRNGYQRSLVCTATLIAPQWVLTAAHCVSFSTTVRSTLEFTVGASIDPWGPSPSFSVDKIHLFGAYAGAGSTNTNAFAPMKDGQGTSDVAILHLASPVPSAIAVPAVLAERPPMPNDLVTVFGYGCQDRSAQRYDLGKQYVSYLHPSSNVLCPGDSGGPVVFGTVNGGGAVWGTNTGYTSSFFSTWDVHGEAYWFRDAILQVITDGARLETDIGRDGMDYTSFLAASAASCRTSCVDDSHCRGFSFSPGQVCSLKSGVPNWTSRPGTVSGSNLQSLPDTNINGGDYKEVDIGTQTADACMSLCANDSICVAYTLVPPQNGDPGRCWLKSQLTSSSAAPGLTSGVRRGFEVDVDLNGAYYNDFALNGPDPNQCASLCAIDSLCNSFTYTAPGLRGPGAHCLLKGGTPAPSSFAGATSGVKRGLQQNSDRWGGDYNSFALSYPMPEECQSACAQDAACKAFTYVPPGWYGSNPSAMCLLKSSVGPLVSNTGLVSGVRGAEFF